jgi:predicted TIM-barrel fold metal-dependent hydrolase
MSKDGKFSQQPPARVSSTLVAPAGACDCHGHIFPAAKLYPTANETMPLAPVEFYLDVHAQLGFTRGVLVQGGAYKFDNSAMLDALDRHRDTLRGVALLPADTGEAELARFRARNVQALRFTRGGASRIDGLADLAPAMRATGLHAEMYIGLDNFVDRAAGLLAYRLPLVLDHLAGPFEAASGVAHPAFQRLLGLLRHEDIWIKLTPQRNSVDFPAYRDVRPFLRRSSPPALIVSSGAPTGRSPI